jgi:hypothetical protein
LIMIYKSFRIFIIITLWLFHILFCLIMKQGRQDFFTRRPHHKGRMWQDKKGRRRRESSY